MDRDTIIRLAREAGFADGVVEIVGLEGFSRFAALVATHERERCAKMCDNLSIDRGMFHPDDEMFKEGILGGARMCAVTIRSRT